MNLLGGFLSVLFYRLMGDRTIDLGEENASERPVRGGRDESQGFANFYGAAQKRANRNRRTQAHDDERKQADGEGRGRRDDALSLRPGSIYSGRVVYVGPKFAKIETSSFRGVVFLGELSGDFISCAADVISEGDEIECVLVERSARKPDEWVVSLAAVAEARVRKALAGYEAGDILEGVVTHIGGRYVQLNCGGIPARVPMEELSWGRIRHPADAVQLHQRCKGEIQNVSLPKGWLQNKRARNAHVVLSLRACCPFPLSPMVGMHFSAQPFRLWAVARKPLGCDAVVLFVLQELDAGSALGDLSTVTGLPANALRGVLEMMEAQGLVQGEALTPRGVALAKAIRLADTANAQPLRGLFVSAAPAALRFQSVQASLVEPEYPGNWPRPPYSRREEGGFSRATDESLPVSLFSAWVSEDRARELGDIWANDAVTVYVRHEGSRPWATVRLEVPEYWVLAGLWRVFEPVGKPPFCPVDIPDYCRNFLLVKMKLDFHSPDAAQSAVVYFEPATRSCWLLRSDRLWEREYAHNSFPDMPDPFALGVAMPQNADVQVNLVWVNVEIQG